MPLFCAIDVIAAHCDGCSRSCSNTMRTARSRILLGTCLVVSSLHPLRGWSLQLSRGGSLVPVGIFGFGGYMAMLVGMQLPTDVRVELTPAEAKAWRADH